ncbi:MAG: response regulator [Candidatus Gastranaerophilales bacterium]|nr:response regulator [Candidatus Gastranaerophilales bacterium]
MGPVELKKILHVEDEYDIQTVVKLSLETLGGFTVHTCSSGKEALEDIYNFNPDLILLDVMMPDIDGPAVLEEIRKIEQFQNTPTIFMTAKAQTNEVETYKSYPGVLGIIVKPFNAILLPQEIKELWRNYHGI